MPFKKNLDGKKKKKSKQMMMIYTIVKPNKKKTIKITNTIMLFIE